MVVGADVLSAAEGNTGAPASRAVPEWSGATDPPGSQNTACDGGFPRNLRDPDVSSATCRGTAERSASERSRGAGKSERRSRSDEAGEPTRGTLRSKGRRRITEPLERKMTETQSSST